MFNDTVAVVRSYNEPNITKFVGDLRKYFPQIIVVVHAEFDQGKTRGWLNEVTHDGVHVAPVLVKDGHGSWSAMLNAGLCFAKGMNSCRLPDEQFEYLFNVSNTTTFAFDQLAAMHDAIQEKNVGVVGTTFAGYLEDGTSEALGSSYLHPRNTGMLISLDTFERHHLLSSFDPRWDGKGGMEDYDFIGKMQALTELRAIMLDLKVPLRIGRHRNQEEYEKMMEDGLRDIHEYHAHF